jgi:hypothetical protein
LQFFNLFSCQSLGTLLSINQSTVNINNNNNNNIMNYIAVNAYRSATDTGFANTWRIYRVTPADRKRLLSVGMPTFGCSIPTPIGLRPATRAEIRAYRRERADSGYTPTLTRDANDNWTDFN